MDIVHFLIVIVNDFLNLDTYDWRNLENHFINKLKNKCHTITRDQCYDETSEEQRRSDFILITKTKEAHLFYGAPDCVIGTLASKFINSHSLYVTLLSLVLLILM
jgi:hypothetical protein